MLKEYVCRLSKIILKRKISHYLVAIPADPCCVGLSGEFSVMHDTEDDELRTRTVGNDQITGSSTRRPRKFFYV